MPEPTTIATAVVSTVGSTVSTSLLLATFFKDIKNTPADVQTCFNLTHRVTEDLDHLISLRRRHIKYLSTMPDIARRVDDIIYATSQSIGDACKLLEGCRKEAYQGHTIPFGKKVQWVLGDSAAFARRTSNLQQQHAALILEVTHLRQVEMLKPLEAMATTTFENLELLTMERKKASYRTAKVNDLTKSEPVTPMTVSRAAPQISFDAVPHNETIYGDTSGSLAARQSSLWPVPTATNFMSHEDEDTEVEESEETIEEDPENVFYRDLRRRQDERHKRLAARKRC